MGKRAYSKQQQRIIEDYYKNLDTIMLQKLQELVTELYLAESEKKREQLWCRVEKAMHNLGIKAGLARHILEKRDPEQFRLCDRKQQTLYPCPV